MVEQKTQQPSVKLQPQETAAKPAEDKEEKITPPQEYSSLKDSIRVTIDQDQVLIEIAGLVAEDIGCYRRVKAVNVTFKQGHPPQIVPVGLDGPITG